MKTLLKMVQDILAEMDSDEVNSIADTIESEQVATICAIAYLEFVEENKLPPKQVFTKLTGVADSTRPTHLTYPTDTAHVVNFQYDKREYGETDPKYGDVLYADPEMFLVYVNSRNLSDTNTSQVTDFNGGTFLIRNDVAPTYWTTFDDKYIVCDSYDSAVDSTLQSSKTNAILLKSSELVLADSTVIDLPNKLYIAFYNKAKARCMWDLKQQVDSLAIKADRQFKIRRQFDNDVIKTPRGKFDGYGKR